MYTHGWFMSVYGKKHHNVVISLQLKKKRISQIETGGLVVGIPGFDCRGLGSVPGWRTDKILQRCPTLQGRKNQRRLMAFKALQDPCSAAHYRWASSPPPLLPSCRPPLPPSLPATAHWFLGQNSLPPDPARLTPSPPSGFHPRVISQSSLP